jgi:hypothetical protein
MKTIQVTHPSGCSMEFSENLLTFLHMRKNSQRFNIGEWLSTLGENLLCQLANVTEDTMLYWAHREIDTDLLFCVKTAFEAETNLNFYEQSMEQGAEVLSTFCIVVSLEKIQRHGWIEIINELSLRPQGSVEYRITEEGMRNKDAFSKLLH